MSSSNPIAACMSNLAAILLRSIRKTYGPIEPSLGRHGAGGVEQGHDQPQSSSTAGARDCAMYLLRPDQILELPCAAGERLAILINEFPAQAVMVQRVIRQRAF